MGRTTTAVMATAAETAETAGPTVSIGSSGVLLLLLLPCVAVDFIGGGTVVLLLSRSAEEMHHLPIDPNDGLIRRL